MIAKLSLLLAVGLTVAANPQATPLQPQHSVLRAFLQGDTSRLSDFAEASKREFAERNVDLKIVRSDEPYDFNFVVVQESSIAGAAGAVVVLDHKGLFVASVVRSGRMSGKGALNASAKELAKKLVVLNGQQ